VSFFWFMVHKPLACGVTFITGRSRRGACVGMWGGRADEAEPLRWACTPWSRSRYCSEVLL